MKEIKDYLHLYLGAQYRIRYIDYQPRQWTVWSTLTPARLLRLEDASIDGIQLQLRPLSNMSEEEKKELWKFIFKRDFHENGRIVFIDKKTTDADPRYVMMSGLERLGIEMNGTIWADSDLHNYKHNQHEVTLWLLSKHFDLFGLIEAGLAIDKSTLK